MKTMILVALSLGIGAAYAQGYRQAIGAPEPICTTPEMSACVICIRCWRVMVAPRSRRRSLPWVERSLPKAVGTDLCWILTASKNYGRSASRTIG